WSGSRGTAPWAECAPRSTTPFRWSGSRRSPTSCENSSVDRVTQRRSGPAPSGVGLTPRRCRDARRQLRRRGSVGYREPVHPEGYLPLAAESPRLHATQNRVSTPNRPRLRGLQSRRSTAPNGRVSFFVLSGDRNNKQTHPETPRAAEASRRRRRRYWLEHEGREI